MAQIKPTHVLNAAGLTGRPNVDWCEDHKVRTLLVFAAEPSSLVSCGQVRKHSAMQCTSWSCIKRTGRTPCLLRAQHGLQLETIRVNVLGMLNLADICNTAKIHLTTYATGCIFHYDKDFPENSGKGFKEDDTPNFTGSYYSYTKVTPVYTLLWAADCRALPAWLCMQHCMVVAKHSTPWVSACSPTWSTQLLGGLLFKLLPAAAMLAWMALAGCVYLLGRLH